MSAKLLLCTLLAAILIGSAAAQSGPAAGYDDPLVYAVDHYSATAESAAADPEAFVASHDEAEEIGAEAEHAAYVSCWTLDVYAMNPDAVCSTFYDGGETVNPPQPEEDVVDENVTDEADELAEDTQEFASDTAADLQAIVDDPANATSILAKMVDRTVAFISDRLAQIDRLATFVQETTIGAVMLVLETIKDLLGIQVEAVSQGLDDVAALGELLATATSDATSAITDTIATVADELTAATKDAVNSAKDAASSVADAASSVADATKAFATGITDAIADASSWIVDSVKELFGADASSSRTGSKPVDGAVDSATGLVGGVTGLVGL